MTRSLEVHVNRSDHHDVSTRTKRFAARGPFTVALTNHGEGVHVHLSVSGDLEIGDATFDGNPFLEADGTLEVPVAVTTDLRPTSGTVDVTSGYGRTGVSVDVDVVDPDDASNGGSSASSDLPSSGGLGTSADGTSGAPSGSEGEPLAERLVDAVARIRPTRAGGADSRRVPTVPALDVGTILLLALAVLAVAVASAVYTAFSGPVVSLGVAVVLATVVGAVVYLLLW